MTGTAIALPTDATSAMALARELSKSRLVPSHFQGSPADIFLAMATCARLGLDFFMSIGEMYLVKNRLAFSGKLSGAIINTSGQLADRLAFEYSGEGEGRKVLVSARLAGETTPRTVLVELAKVRTANDVWKTQPDQQLAYAGSRIWGRRHTPELLLGLLFEGETIDVTPSVVTREAGAIDVTLSQADRSKAVEAIAEQATHAVEEVETATRAAETTGEAVQPFAITREEAGDWRTWATLLLAYVRASPAGHTGVDVINEWCVRNADQLSLLKRQEPANHKRLVDLIQFQITERMKAANG